MPLTPDFRSSEFLRGHIAWMMDFYHPRCIDPRGGYFHFYQFDGAIHKHDVKELVSSARMVVSYSMAQRALGRAEYDAAIRHGVDFLWRAHRHPVHRGFAWQIEWRDGAFAATDDSNQCYGFAFVALAMAHAAMAGVSEAKGHLAEIYDLMEAHFYDPAGGLYLEERTVDWRPVNEYRGQNANMHCCEAFLAAHEATGEARYLARALQIADLLCRKMSGATHGLVWEHYTPDWRQDFAYNYRDYANIYRPWGYQVGHQTEWSKFLVHLHQRAGEPWLLEKAVALFDKMMALAWDHEHGGFAYSLDDKLGVANNEKYFWTQNETAATAGILARAVGNDGYWAWHDRIWALCWEKLVDHERGSWNRLYSPDWRLIAPEKGVGGKDYHIIGGCFDLLRRG